MAGKNDSQDSMEALDLEAGLEAAFEGDDSAPSDDVSVLAQLAGDGRKLVPVLLKEPESNADLTPVVRPRTKKSRGRQGRYQVLGEIARGGVGVVFRGHDIDLGRDVAMKVIREEHQDTPEIIQRFVEEAQIGGQLQHPGIVPVYEIGLGKDKRPYFTMKLIKGKTLSALLGARQTPRQGRRRALSIFESVCQTMAYAHARGVIHRDLKPSNIMVGSFGEVLVVDWGMGKVLRTGGVADERAAKRKAEQTVVTTLRSEGEGSASVIGSVMGTPRYMSPEQARGDIENVDERSDVFGLGAVLCEILTGAPPYNGKDNEVFAQASMAELDDAYQRLAESGADKDLVKLAKRCLTPAPQARFANASAVAKAIGEHISASEERAEEAKLAAVRAEERVEAERAEARSARRIATKEKEAADQARKARRLTLALTSVVLLAVAAAGGLWFRNQRAQEQKREKIAQAVSGHLVEAARFLKAGKLDEASESVARAHERDPDAAGPVAFRARIAQARQHEQRTSDLAAAQKSRDDARDRLTEYTALKESIESLAAQVKEERDTIYRRHADDDKRAAFALREIELEKNQARRPALLASARESVERARRVEEKWGQADTDTLALLADIFVEQWRLARAPKRGFIQHTLSDMFDAEGDLALASAHHAAAMRHDVSKRHREELLGRGTLRITVTPADAEVHLFRYESYETVRTDRPVIPRLVPVPTTGIGRANIDGFTPGDTCFVIQGVAPGSPAARATLATGDLILTVNKVPCDNGECILAIVPGSRAERAGMQPWQRIEKAGRFTAFHWQIAQNVFANMKRQGKAVSVTAGGIRVEAPAGEQIGIRHGSTLGLLTSADWNLRMECQKDGSPLTVELPKGQASGITARVTAYPLVFAEQNRVKAGQELQLDPGSYLVHLRRKGFEPQRESVVIPRGASVEVELELHKDATSPDGFVYVPPGPFVFGDRKAFRAAPRTKRVTDGYWIQATLLTFGQYLEFINDPEVLDRIEKSENSESLLPAWSVAKDTGKRSLVVEKDDQGLYRPRPPLFMETPLLGIYINAPFEYVKWRNAKAKTTGEPWIFDLPSEAEYEKAARGTDGRAFTWGPRYDGNLCVGQARVPRGRTYWAPVRFEPRDESPYGMADVVGTRWEFARTSSPSAQSGRSNEKRKRWCCKASGWSGGDPRVASRGYGDGTSASGFRLVAQLRDEG